LRSKRGEDRRAPERSESLPRNANTEESAERGASTPARLAAVAAVLIAFAVVVVLLLGGDGGNKYTLLFQTGGQLVPGNQVLVAGQPIGSVDSIDLTDDNQAAVQVTMTDPIREGTTAVIRSTSLSGVANRYISLTPGPNNGPDLDPGTVIEGDDTTAPVDLDQLFNIFQPKERKALQKFIQGNATVYAGKGELANRAYKFLNPALSTSTQLFTELSSDSVSLSRFLVAGSQTFGALADRQSDLTSLISNTNQTLAAIASRNEDLDRSLAALPETLRLSNTTFVNLRATLDDLDPLVQASYPATKNLAPFLQKLAAVSNKSVPVFSNLADITHLKGANNDLADTLKELPTTKKKGKKALPAATKALNDSIPDLAFFRPYAPDVMAWLSKFGEVTAYYNGDGHYARVQPAGANVFNYNNPAPGLATADYTTNTRQFPVTTSAPYFENPTVRCPGGGSAPAPDNSNPFVSPSWPVSGLDPSDCNAGQIPPGP
jgi:phospholipid/cholesterol/gamma-HCH transport system substrate-binding protein